MRSQPTSSSARNGQLVRLLRILRDLDRLDGVDIYELAERYGASTRTIRRDLDALQEAGLALEQMPHERRQRWQLARNPQARRMAGLLDASHLLALKAAEGQNGPARSVASFWASLEDLSSKIEGALGDRGRKQLTDIERCFFHYDKGAYASAPPDVFWPIVQAVADKRLCRVTYQAPRAKPEPHTFDILPLKLFVYQAAPYLMCHIRKHDTLASLNLQRLRSLQVLTETAEPPASFDPHLLEHAAFGVWSGGSPTDYTLRFDAEIAPYIRERLWHPTQKLRPLDSDGVELTFTCSASVEVEAWVASWRHHVVVVQPTSLRQSFHDLGLSWAQQYAC